MSVTQWRITEKRISYLGYYYLLKSDYATSKEYWNKILAIDPTNATANKALDGIK